MDKEIIDNIPLISYLGLTIYPGDKNRLYHIVTTSRHLTLQKGASCRKTVEFLGRSSDENGWDASDQLNPSYMAYLMDKALLYATTLTSIDNDVAYFSNMPHKEEYVLTSWHVPPYRTQPPHILSLYVDTSMIVDIKQRFERVDNYDKTEYHKLNITMRTSDGKIETTNEFPIEVPRDGIIEISKHLDDALAIKLMLDL